MSLKDEDLYKEFDQLVKGSCFSFVLKKPLYEDQLGVYKTEEGNWRVSLMGERGHLFVVGTFAERETAIKEARQYLIELRDMFRDMSKY